MKNARQAMGRRRAGTRGVTLIELMIVVVVVGILAAIAYPSFQDQVRKSRRADGKAALLEKAQELERCYTRFAAYNNGGCDVDLPEDSPEAFYVVSDVALTPSAFTLQAVPQDDQTNDVCGTLTLTQAGVQGADDDVETCW